MTYSDFYKKIKEVVAENEDYNYIGVRFENKERKIGEICERSRHNEYREDEREFPEYGTEEYENTLELNGTSSWLVYNSDFDWADEIEPEKNFGIALHGRKLDDTIYTGTNHAYLIAGKRENTHSDCDCGEVVIEEAEVIGIIF